VSVRPRARIAEVASWDAPPVPSRVATARLAGRALLVDRRAQLVSRSPLRPSVGRWRCACCLAAVTVRESALAARFPRRARIPLVSGTLDVRAHASLAADFASAFRRESSKPTRLRDDTSVGTHVLLFRALLTGRDRETPETRTRALRFPVRKPAPARGARNARLPDHFRCDTAVNVCKPS
jgi:hypothetical protein